MDFKKITKFKDLTTKRKWQVGSGVVLAGALVFFTVNQSVYVKRNNITTKTEKEISTYLEQKPKDYLVYFYDKDDCDTCGAYSKELKKYEKKDKALPVFKVTSREKNEIKLENDIFVDRRYPTVIHVVDGVEEFRYVGSFPIDKLPLKGETAKKENPKKKEKEEKNEADKTNEIVPVEPKTEEGVKAEETKPEDFKNEGDVTNGDTPVSNEGEGTNDSEVEKTETEKN